MNFEKIKEDWEKMVDNLPRNKDGIRTVQVKDLPELHRKVGFLIELVEKLKKRERDLVDMVETIRKNLHPKIDQQKQRIEELEEELEGKSCMTKCSNCGELASSSEINTNAYIRKLEGEIVRLNKEISYLLEETEWLEHKLDQYKGALDFEKERADGLASELDEFADPNIFNR